MGEPALKQAKRALATRREWVLAVVAAGLSRGCRHAARYIASLPSFPYAFFTVGALGKELGVSERQARRVLAELSAAGFVERWASFFESSGLQRSNDYVLVMPRVGEHPTNVRVDMDVRPLRGDSRRERREREEQSTRTHVPAREAPAAASASRSIETSPENDQEGASAPEEGEGRGEDAQNPPPPQLSPLADVAWPSEERCRELDGPGLVKVRPKPPYTALRRAAKGCAETSLPPELRAKLLALPGGQDALSALAGAQLTAAREVEVVERVLAYHHAKGVAHAGKFIHGPIRDVKNRVRDEAELRAAEKHDDWDAGIKQAAAATEAQRIPIPISPPPKPLPKRTKLEERRDTIAGTLLLPPGLLNDAKRAALERELREVEATIEAS